MVKEPPRVHLATAPAASRRFQRLSRAALDPLRCLTSQDSTPQALNARSRAAHVSQNSTIYKPTSITLRELTLPKHRF
eukprot:2449967-Prymnesium_polylepis.1